jgi:hypothetical protein
MLANGKKYGSAMMKNVAVEIRDRATFIPAFFTVMVAENGNS